MNIMTNWKVKFGSVPLLVGGFTATLGNIAVAAVINPPNVNITDKSQFLTALDNVVNFAFVLFFTVAAFFFLWAAFDYLTAAGDTTKLGTAKSRLIYGIIAVVLAAVAKSLPLFIPTFIQ